MSHQEAAAKAAAFCWAYLAASAFRAAFSTPQLQQSHLKTRFEGIALSQSLFLIEHDLAFCLTYSQSA